MPRTGGGSNGHSTIPTTGQGGWSETLWSSWEEGGRSIIMWCKSLPVMEFSISTGLGSERRTIRVVGIVGMSRTTRSMSCSNAPDGWRRGFHSRSIWGSSGAWMQTSSRGWLRSWQKFTESCTWAMIATQRIWTGQRRKKKQKGSGCS